MSVRHRGTASAEHNLNLINAWALADLDIPHPTQ